MKLFNPFIILGILSNLLLSKVDLDLSGKTTLFYQTLSNDDYSAFKQERSFANALFQMNVNADLGNNFSAMIEGTFLGTLGLEKKVIEKPIQRANGEWNSASVTQVYLKKTFDKTDLKLGRMNISKSISPFIYSEGWTPSKNSLDAILLIDRTLLDTTLVGGFISQRNKSFLNQDMSKFTDIEAGADRNSTNGVFLFTLKNKTIDFLPINYSYYLLSNVNDSKKDIQIHSLNTNIISQDFSSLSLGLQGGQINSDSITTTDKNTIYYGVKLSYKMNNKISLSSAYTSVDKGSTPVHNLATGIKSPLYTQMLLNQFHIKKDSKSFVLKGSMSDIIGEDKAIVQYGQSKIGDQNTFADDKFKELDLIYKIKLAKIDFFTGYSWIKTDSKKAQHFVRLWGKYTF